MFWLNWNKEFCFFSFAGSKWACFSLFLWRNPGENSFDKNGKKKETNKKWNEENMTKNETEKGPLFYVYACLSISSVWKTGVFVNGIYWNYYHFLGKRYALGELLFGKVDITFGG